MKFFIIIKEKSERLRDKNFLDLGGKPLFKHLLDELQGQDVFIDTDSDMIFNNSPYHGGTQFYLYENQYWSMARGHNGHCGIYRPRNANRD